MGQYTVDQNTVALLHFEDGFKDECGNVWTATGTPALDTTEKYFGSSALHIPGSSYLKTINEKFKFGDGDFTIDFWVKTPDPSANYFISSSIYDPEYVVGVGVLNAYAFIGARVSIIKTGSLMVPTNEWTHVAVVRKGLDLMVFIQGKLKEKVTGTATVNSDTFSIGVAHVAPLNYVSTPFHMDELRISNIARWAEDFIPGGEPGEITPIPTNLVATGGDRKVALSWNAVAGATGYNVKRSTTAGGPYTTIASNVSGTSYEDTNVVNGTTYYYVVTAIGPKVESANSNEASATPNAVVAQEVLRVTMIDSSEREYQLPSTDIAGFVNWFNRPLNTGTTGYMLNKSVGLQQSKEYLAFDKIISFEIIGTSKI